MKKIIISSTVLSTLLLAVPTVNNLNVDQTNSASSTQTTDVSTVRQGKIDITGDSTQVTDLTITQESAGNRINQSSITDSTLYQGETRVTNDAIVNSVEIDSDSSINNSDILNGSTVRQSDTEIDNSTATNLIIKSTNTIETSSKIDGSSTVEQGSLIITDSNASDSDVANTDIQSTNRVSNTEILEDSVVYQSYTKIGSVSTVNGLNLVQTNTIEDTKLDEESDVYQSNTIVDGSTVVNLKQTVTNIIEDTLSQDSNIFFSGLEQASIEITDSDVKDVTIVATTQNSIRGVIADDTTVKQNGLYTDNGAVVRTLTINENNDLQNSSLEETDFLQGNININ